MQAFVAKAVTTAGNRRRACRLYGSGTLQKAKAGDEVTIYGELVDAYWNPITDSRVLHSLDAVITIRGERQETVKMSMDTARSGNRLSLLHHDVNRKS